jgi:hypothetical protein
VCATDTRIEPARPGRAGSAATCAIILGLPQQDLAELAGVHRNTLRTHPESPRLQPALRDLMRVLSAATAVEPDPQRAIFLVKNEPIPAFRHKTLLQLVQEGRAEDVIGYLESISTGFMVNLTTLPDNDRRVGLQSAFIKQRPLCSCSRMKVSKCWPRATLVGMAHLLSADTNYYSSAVPCSSMPELRRRDRQRVGGALVVDDLDLVRFRAGEQLGEQARPLSRASATYSVEGSGPQMVTRR